MIDGESDEELMARAATGDHAAFRRVMARHMGRAMRVAETVVRSSAEADDIAQEAFIRIWRNAASFDPAVARFTTWMHRIVVNLAIDRKRAANGHVELPEDIHDGKASALDEMIGAEREAVVSTALAELPERQRAAIALFHFEGLSGRDSAHAMNLSESAFESLLTRARSALKQRVLTTMDTDGRAT